MFGKKSSGAIATSLILAVALWGASNAGTKYVVTHNWPPVWTGATRMLCAGWLLLAMLRWTPLLGELLSLTREERHGMWWRGGVSLAAYMIVFNYAMHLTEASHVALYLGTAPVWALLWEERPALTWRSAQRYGAGLLALSGVVVLLWPALRSSTAHLAGEVLGLACSITWVWYGRECRSLGRRISGAEVSAHTLWRSGVLMLPVALVELALNRDRGFLLAQSDFWQPNLVLTQLYCIVGGGVCSYALWNNGLRHWPTSRVFLFNNLIPLSTMTWSHFLLGEPITPTFWLAMVLIVLGVVIGQTNFPRVLAARWLPME